VISAGLLRYRATVYLLGASDTIGEATGYAISEEPYVRVELRHLSGAEVAWADGPTAMNSWQVRCRWPDIARCGITETSRLVVRGKTLRINSIVNTYESDRVAVLTCTEVT
jgi:hypothetical protein